MSSDSKKTELTGNTLNKPMLISEGILMYPERLDLDEEMISRVAMGGYMVVLGGQSFVIAVTTPKER